MKEYFKNALIICAEMTLLVVCWGLAEFGLNRPPMSWQYVEITDEMEAEHE